MIRAGRALAVVVGTGLGTGFSPIASGTAGSLLGVVLYLPLAAAGLPAVGLAVALLFPVGVWAAGVCGKRYGAHDHGRIVVDEIVGQFIALAGFPAQPGWLLAGFLLFRLFDIWKPYPAGLIDRPLAHPVRRDGRRRRRRRLRERRAPGRPRLPGVLMGAVDSLAARVGRALLARDARLALAESCTGGLVGGRVTAVPGSSRYLLGGVVAYHNSAKAAVLQVPRAMLGRAAR